ncbi:MAG: hypothetical protein JXQ83_15245, partial [Candidatus Glassbacteria bacterium]|nr:hypothetical protein [Candidatus Glassbacteria bacterium]
MLVRKATIMATMVITFLGASVLNASRIMTNFFPFSHPKETEDPHVYDEMMYYGYWGGCQLTNVPIIYLASHSSDLINAPNETAWWNEIYQVIDETCYSIRYNPQDYPPRDPRTNNMYKKIFMNWSSNLIYEKFVVDYINEENMDSPARDLAIEATARIIYCLDTLARGLYKLNSTDTVIHQVCEEINYQWRGGIDGQGFLKFTGGDSAEAASMFFTVMDSIAEVVEYLSPDRCVTAVEWHYIHDPKHADKYENCPDFRSGAIDGMPHIGIYFMAVTSSPPEYDLKEINEADLGSRKLGIRYSWVNDRADFDMQVNALKNIEYWVPNA